ncbi:two-component system activity regulator YycH [Bombilactobacillus folatiphilus]|uniref:Two-component system activity regulator YycH n=1 Tax=Bombilactobacillus folatiphilus TaxID=2923362 RepID=A0ABY4P905_9LACO|nr:two-component system activity regulator YycH [Bombilactobacillus folatiphilus]UQS82102.1 two-component system activity regulator YycH [Bombilactobacillus folatiphilus]
MKQLNNWVLRILLMIAVLISLILSWMIWTNNAKYQQALPNVSRTHHVNQRSTAIKKDMGTIFAPTKMVLTQHHKQYVASNNQSNMINSTMKVLQRAQFKDPRKIVTQNSQRYQRYLRFDSSLQLIYPSTFTFNSLMRVMNQTDRRLRRDINFNRILIQQKGNHLRLFLLDDRTFTVYYLDQSQFEVTKLSQMVNRKNFKTPVFFHQEAKNISLYYDKPIRLAKVSYLLSKQTNNFYVTNLLNSRQDANISTRKNGNLTVYRNGDNRSLVVDNKIKAVTYSDYSKTDMPKNIPDLLNQSFQLLSNVGNSLNNLYLFSHSQNNTQLVFRTYVNGFPIFNQSKFGAVTINYSNDAQTAYFSKKNLQVPLPTEQAPVQLPSTHTVIEQLTHAGYSSKNIQKVLIGYTWAADDQNKEIVDLTPEYYILINNQWKTFNDWLNRGRQ